jgi:raffinose/stachyose/melibiose transport system permease protein
MTGIATTRGRAAAPPRGRRRGARLLPPWWFAVPALAFFAFAVIVPSLQGVWFSLQDWNGFGTGGTFTGLTNYLHLFEVPAAAIWIRNTILIAVAATVLQTVIGLLLALGVHAKIKTRHALRVVFFAPMMIVPVVVAFVWQFIFGPTGAASAALDALGIAAPNWLGDANVALGCIIVVIVWQYAGYSMVIFLAGLEGVPSELLEAAAMDGAGALSRFRHVTLPALAPAMTTNILLASINGLMVFDVIWVMTQGGPGGLTDSISTAIFRTAFSFSQVGLATSMAVIFAILVGVISLVQYRVLTRRAR